MGKRISEKIWRTFREQHPEAIEELVSFNIGVDRYGVFSNFASVKKKGKSAISKTNTERYGVELGPVIDWLDDNSNDEYYAEIDQEGRTAKMQVTFYFKDEGDAVACKLMFGERT